MPLRQTSFRLETEILDALQAIKERDGIAVTEELRRALLDWIEKKGIAKPASRRAGTRRKA